LKLAIVATLYYSSPHLDEFYRRAVISARQLTDDYTIVLVNDGSPDDSLDRAIRLAETDDHVLVVDLSRNFGHHKAMMTGLAHAEGDLVFLIDSDLEEEPEWLLTFDEQMLREQCDVVYGVQASRRGRFLDRWLGQCYYWLMRVTIGMDLPENITTARLMTRRYVDALLQFREREVYLLGLWYLTGFVQTPQAVQKHSTSESTYTFRRKVAMVVNAASSFSNVPLVGIFYFGIAISLAASLYIAYVVILWLSVAQQISGWTSIIASIWLIGGVVISFIGVVGIYLSKVFSETKRRPYTIIRQVYGKREIV